MELVWNYRGAIVELVWSYCGVFEGVSAITFYNEKKQKNKHHKGDKRGTRKG